MRGVIRTDQEDHQILVTLETVGFRGAFAVRPWVDVGELRVAIEDIAKECGRALDVAIEPDTWDVDVRESERERLVTDGGVETGGRLHGRDPDRRVERPGDDLLVFTSETEDYRIVEVCADTETRHPVAFETGDNAWAAMHAYADLFGFELVRKAGERDTESGQPATDGGIEMAPSMDGATDELLHVPDRFRDGGHIPGKDIRRARLVEVETPHPGPDRQVLEIHTDDGVAYRYQRYETSEDFAWFHWQRPGQDPREQHPNIPYGIEVFVGLINGEGVDRIRPEPKAIPALDPDESREIRTDGGQEVDSRPDGEAEDEESFYNLQEANEANTVGLAEFDRAPTSSMLERFRTHILRRAILEFEREFDQRDAYLRTYEDPNGHPAIAMHPGPSSHRGIVAAGMIDNQPLTDGGRDIRERAESLKRAVAGAGRSRGVVELSLRDALEASEDREVNYHIRQALQLLDVDREGSR